MQVTEAPPATADDEIVIIDWEPRKTKELSPSKPKSKPAVAKAQHRRRASLYLPFALVLQVLYLLPALRTGWLNDDGAGYNYSAYLDFFGNSFWSDTTRQIGVYMETGRFYPTLFYQGYGTLYWVQNEVVYKALLIALTSVASVAVYFVLRRLRITAPIAALSIVIATACMQMRDYHDPILSYYGFMQLLLIELCVSMLLLDTWLKRGGRWRLFASVALFALACSTYELTSVFALLYAPIVLSNPVAFKRRALALAPFFVTSAVFIGILAFLRSISTKAADNYEATFELDVVLNTFAKQEFGTLPGSFQAHPQFWNLRSASAFIESVSGAAVALGVFALVLTVLFALRGRVLRGNASIVAPMLFGLGLIVLPALPLSIAPKYQNELEWGWSYLPVLFQVFGFGLVVSLCAQQLVRKRRAVAVVSAVVLAGVVGIATAYDSSLNNLTVTELAKWKTIRVAQQTALQDGLMRNVPDGSVVFVAPTSYWQTPFFFYRYTDGKRFDSRISDATMPTPTMDDDACTQRTDVAYVFETQLDDRNENPQIALKCFPLANLRR